jgi:hypothetical protein
LMVKDPLLRSNVTSNARRFRDTGDSRTIPELSVPLHVSHVDQLNHKKTSKQNYIHSEVHLDSVPSRSRIPALAVAPNRNNYELKGVPVVMSSVRPSQRKVSKFGAHSGGTIVRPNQVAPITGAVLKSR